jgi:hypothetical protein
MSRRNECAVCEWPAGMDAIAAKFAAPDLP